MPLNLATIRITGLDPAPYLPLYGLPDEALAGHGARRYRVDEDPGFPDRIELSDVPVGRTVLLLNHVSQPASSPYRASHAIFVREGATERFDRTGEIPDVMRRRMLSLRGFDDDGMMVDADLVDGREAETLIERLLARDEITSIHVHYARRGCYAGLIRRA
jgi:hypothetical protein